MKVAVNVGNTTGCAAPGGVRDHVTRRSLVAVHTLLAVDDGAFVSLLDPPAAAAEAAAGCTSVGTYPVLVGDGSDDDVVLSSPIILYDHPAVAPESQGDMCDATEIDEILALRVLTLTDEEKAEARGTDARAAAIVDRWEDMPPEVWERLHGTVRSIGPAVTAAPRARSRCPGGSRPWTPRSIPGPTRCASVTSTSPRAPGCGCDRRGGPTRTTCSSPAWTPPWPACSTTWTVSCTWP